MSNCKHDFDSNEESNYCARGCGETWALWTIKSLQSQIKKAEEVIGFYADKNVWQVKGRDEYCVGKNRSIIPNLDLDKESEFDLECGGKRAREYFKNKEEKALKGEGDGR